MSTGNTDSNPARERNHECDRKFNIKEVQELKDESCANETADHRPLFHEHRKSLRSKKKICDGDKALCTQSSVENVKASVELKKAGCSKGVDSKICSKHKHRRKLKTSPFVSKSKLKKKKSSCFAEGTNTDETCMTKCDLYKSDNSSKRKRKSNFQPDIQDTTKRSAGNYHVHRRQKVDNFLHLPVEIICYIFQLLTLREILCLEHLSKKMQEAVLHYLKYVKSIDFNEHIGNRKLFEGNLSTLTNFMFTSLLKKLPKLQTIYNFHPINLKLYEDIYDETSMTVAAVCHALRQCESLESIEISNVHLLYMITYDFKNVQIIGKFQNWNNLPSFRLDHTVELKEGSRISHLHLTDCEIENLPQMDEYLEHLYLRNVKFGNIISTHPFRDFSALKLKSFVMSQCDGPTLPMKYLPLINALADAFRLKRVELQDIPYLGGVIKNVCAANWKEGAFRRLESVVIGNCSNLQNADIGYLLISAACRIETLRLQPSLSKDAIFHALVAADVTINPGFQELYLGWQDHSSQSSSGGVSDVSYGQCSLTDSGMRIVGKCFPSIKKLQVRNCPYFKDPIDWLTPGQQYWKNLEELSIYNCQCLHVDWFADFLPLLPNLKFLTLQKVFKEPPYGCSRVGLTAGTGIGAITTMANNDIDDNIHIVVVENEEANENGAENNVIDDVANQNAAENHVIEDVANENGAQNHVIDVANENRVIDVANENRVIDVANENGAENHVIADVANENGAENHVIEKENAALNPDINRTEQASERLENARYNLRHSSRYSCTAQQAGVGTRCSSTTPQSWVITGSSSTSPQTGVSARSSSTSPQTGVSARTSSTAHQAGVSTRSSSTAHQAGVSTRSRDAGVHTRSSSTSHADINDSVSEKPRSRKRRYKQNPHSDKDPVSESDTNVPHSSVDKSDNTHSSSKHSTASNRGKALVTKNGIVSKAKSSSKKRMPKRKCKEPTVISQSMATKPRVCTCKKPTTDKGSQVTTRDIKNSFKQAYSGKRTTRRNSHMAEKIIEPGIYRLACKNVCGNREERCIIHRPYMRDQSDGTSDPVGGVKYSKVIKISHSRLEYLKLDDIGMSTLTIDCPLLNTLSVSRCTMWKTIQFEDAPNLANVHISQCRVLCEPQIMHHIYRLPNTCSKFVSLRPLHMVDESLFTNLQFNWDHRNNNFGSLMMFDRSDKPSETNYNKLRMKSWTNMLERMSTEARAEFGFPEILEMEEQRKWQNMMTGQSSNGSKWNLLMDNPWIALLDQCPDIDDKYLTNPDSSKEGVYCMERKGHHSFWDAYGDIYEAIPSVRSRDIGLYNCNVLTYINLCDVSGTPTLDGLNVL